MESPTVIVSSGYVNRFVPGGSPGRTVMVVLVKACMAIIQRQNEQLNQILESV